MRKVWRAPDLGREGGRRTGGKPVRLRLTFRDARIHGVATG